jgi:hypothetical protein
MVFGSTMWRQGSAQLPDRAVAFACPETG